MTAPPRRPSRVAATALTAALTALAALSPSPAAAEPADGIPALLGELRTLCREADEATAAYQEAAERLRAQRAEADRLGRRLAGTRGDLAGARRTAGRLASAQYRAGGRAGGAGLAGIPPYVRMLLGEDPGRALHEARIASRVSAAQAAEIARLVEGERRADALATAAREALDAERTLAGRQRERRAEVRRRLDEVTRLLAGLSPAERSALTRLEETESEAARREMYAEGALPPADAAPSAAGRAALGHALEQLGRPYAFGEAGPGAFDGPGLAARAWAAAGRAIPATAAAQWAELPRVPLNRLRPGDLVFYSPAADDPRAADVALYAGEGEVVAAPGPGRRVARTPVTLGHLLGAARPDAAAPAGG
ncbi:C40 family peptidase [Streptomyces hoynatensis]|uniref:NlpC/P60 domain-containing protein n=1 Tax=Streptomyces hoynatensis TaxID=1141874 RepID=A0A3A9YWR2_9ACTN|nr:NlpC/P60 family protein [Streptomyces hoynatensis]RKN40448.1 hypothetical protein D7294_18560 [Streptomyces hoynatensis]